ncbi:hypothetical protein MGU_08553 [Metarhizium guizhouense ARSEF 977]|uniref:Hydroxymethyltransferase n=1 Tax=Metarhizium guizhouense (strain ARSEF 977) TaxID=1276136 RepID=A0A0B4GBL8_METGA|nr:hypothetical protein MGU_08553 [Metarhizium guizhouense ARSEF 977]
MSSITRTVEVGPNPTEWYGTMIVKGIKYDDDAFNVFGSPWQDVTPDVTNEPIDASTCLVAAKLNFEKSYEFNTSDTITIGVKGDLRDHPEPYTESVRLAADAVPDVNGTVAITTADAPNPALESEEVTLSFAQGSRNFTASALPGMTTLIKLPYGEYVVSCSELTTADQTVVATSEVSPSSLTVDAGEEVAVEVTFSSAQTYGAIDVSIGDIPSLESEMVHTTRQRHYGDSRNSGTVEFSIHAITLNNVQYEFSTKSLDLAAQLFNVTFGQSDVTTSPVDTTDFVELPIVMESDVAPDKDITVRIASDELIYTQKVPAKAGTTPFSVPVASDQYDSQDYSFVMNGTVYAVNSPSTFMVLKDGSTRLNLELVKGANLHVKGFPDVLTFGGLADMTPTNADDFVAARASSIFKYAGDSGTFLTDDPATRRTIQLARDIEAKLGDGSPVLPIMISYTVNLSLGDIYKKLQDTTGLTHSFANLILSLNISNTFIDQDHPVPAGFIVNADFLGEGQKENLVDYAMPVRKPLQGALDHWNVEATIPDSIEDTFAGYTLAVNWLVRTVAPTATFGWQVNIWGGGTSTWIYDSGPGDQQPLEQAKQTADYIKQLGTYASGDYTPDFLAVDRYEADDWTVRAYVPGYFYGPHEWRRYYDFVRYLGLELQVPVAPWQIPSSHAPLVMDAVASDFDAQHWGTGGSYLLGDADVGSDIDNINPTVLDLELNDRLIKAKTAGEVWQRGESFDLTQPAYQDFPLRGIFTVLLGGGSTTGIISTVGNAGEWVAGRLRAYADNPIPLDEYPLDASGSGGARVGAIARRIVLRK